MVPNGWKQKSFKDILKLDRGSSPRPIVNFMTDSDDGVNWIKIGDTKGEAAFINSTKEKITKEGAKKSREVSKGEIILSNSMSYGKPYILNIDGYIHDGWFVIRNYEQNLDKGYLIQLLGGEIVQRQYKRLAAGGVVTNISSELVYFVKVNLPPLPEQRKIAKILSTWDKAISTTERLIDNSKQQKKALMQQLLTGKKRLLDDSGKPFEGDWEEVKLSDVFTLSSGDTKPKDVEKEQTNTQCFPVFGGNNIMGYSAKSNSTGNVILIGRVGEYCGVTRLVQNDCWITDNALFTKKFSADFDKQFIVYLLQKFDLSRLRNKGGQPLISQKPIYGVKIEIPSLHEQQKVASVLLNADREIEVLQQQLADLKQEKKALMQQLLTGKRRVKT
ncbi:restriction endonuclease subunit S [Pseudoalteromonas sp. ESRF-bin5]|uniref:restriction endonuclease subunit S n=1 Tax=Pseudoalteromonas sp. ESRF-bin5 TaxID=2014532 RepID=UPI00257AFA80|nr:restriction endonuclease subunit S [Pseudoalteromonas sp. ESRF-bin5]